MDLADRGCGDGFFVERREEVAPVGAEVAGEDFVALGWGHVVGAVLDPLEDFVDCWRKHFGI